MLDFICNLHHVLQVVTPSSFLLNTQSLSEVTLSLKSLQPGAISVIITAVDMDSQQVIKAWMVCGNTLEPTITKAFQITLPTGGTKPITKVMSTELAMCMCVWIV